MLRTALSALTDWTWLLTAFVAVVTLYLVRHFQEVRSLPPGPFSLPILGNLLELRGKAVNMTTVIEKYQRKYKNLFTLWIGNRPTIMVCSWDLCHEALMTKRNDFSGRITRDSTQLFLHGDHDVVFNDFGPSWETLRKVMATAVRKYAGTEKLAELVNEVTDKTAAAMVQDKQPVDARSYIMLIIYNILASSIFGQRFELDDPKFIRLKDSQDELNEKFGVGLPSDAVPFLRVFYQRQKKDVESAIMVLHSHLREKLIEHQKTFESDVIRDFTDALLSAKEEAQLEGKGALKHLTDGNLMLVMSDLFAAGTDTSKGYLMWTLLFITNQLEIQRKMQEEIDANIGSRYPTQADKNQCPYVNAVLTEVLRFRPIVDFTLEHKTMCDTELGGYKIPKDTSCLFYIKGPQNDHDHWKEPSVFKPERFLDKNGQFMNQRFTGYMPFGLGRRACPGEKLALADVFLVVTRLLQTHDLELAGGPGSVPLTFFTKKFTQEPMPYKLIVKKR